MAQSSAYMADVPLGLIAGQGALPEHIAQSHSGPLHIIGIETVSDHALVDAYPHCWCRIGAVGKAMDYLRKHDVQQLVMAGYMKRPRLSTLWPDRHGASLLKRLGGGMMSGDNQLLSTICSYFEEQGFTVIGAHQICTDLTISEGCITQTTPDAASQKDIAEAVSLLAALSPFDVGQAAIIEAQRVIGIEAAEGTAALITRCAPHLSTDKTSVLVKLPKQAQELRLDMPAIGLDTIHAMQKSGISGIAIGANATLLLDKDAMIAFADRHSIFIVATAI